MRTTIDRAAESIAEKVMLGDLLRAVPHPLLVLDTNLFVLAANQAYYDTFQVNERETLGRYVCDLGRPRWSLAEAEDSLKEVSLKGNCANFIVESTTENLGQGAMQLQACQITSLRGRSNLILLAVDDISDQQSFEQSLRLNDHAIRSTSNGIVVVDAKKPDRPIVFVNPAFEKMTGYAAHEVLGRNPRFLQRGDRDQPDVPALRKAINEGREVHAVVRNYRKNGTMFWNELTISPVHDREGRLTHFVGIQNDVTKRKLAEEALHERQQRLSAIVNTAIDAIVTIDQYGAIESFNPGAVRMFGHDAEKVIGKPVDILVPPPCRDGQLMQFKAGIAGEAIGRRKNGSTFPMDVAVSELDGPKRFVAIIRDISDRKALQTKVLEIAEQEQRRIGQELHDGTGQQLIGLGFLLDDLTESLAARSLPEAKTANRICEALGEALKHVKLLSHGLLPVELDSDGLVAALNELAATINEVHGMHCTFDCGNPIGELDDLVATNFYRIAQEAVANALKHANAKHIRITVSTENNSTVLTILDNGEGISAQAQKSAGAGIKIMKYRAELLGGTLNMGPAKRGGTLVSCTLVEGSKDAR